MKNLSIILICLFLTTAVSAQVKFGVRAGVSSTDLASKSFRVENQDVPFSVMIKNANYGYHLGLFLQAGGEKFFIQPEILFNSSSVDYTLSEEDMGGVVNTVFKETYNDIDIPVMLGYRLGLLRLQGGPVGHFHINSSSELTDVSGYEEKFKTFTYGYQAGVGLDIWRLVIDAKYEGNFNNFGEHFTFSGQEFDFDQSPARVVVSVGLSF